jgi:hypothetical protein
MRAAPTVASTSYPAAPAAQPGVLYTDPAATPTWLWPLSAISPAPAVVLTRAGTPLGRLIRSRLAPAASRTVTLAAGRGSVRSMTLEPLVTAMPASRPLARSAMVRVARQIGEPGEA